MCKPKCMANTTMSPYIITVHVLFEKCNFKLELNEVLCNKVVIYMKKYEDIYKKKCYSKRLLEAS